MAKKATSDPSPMRGFNDIIGIVLMGSAVLLLIALLSYDAHDLAQNTTEINHPARNWIGPIGAHIAYYSLWWVGVPAYVGMFLRAVGLCSAALDLDRGTVCLLYGTV